jgi:PAS domain S-box-containing protein
MKFVHKLTALFISINAIIVAVMITIAYFQMAKTLESEIRERMENCVFFTMDAMDRFLYERLSDIKMIAKDPVISSENATAEQITERLIFFRNAYKCYISLSFFNLERIRIADTAGLNIGEQNQMTRYWEDVLSGKVSAASDVHITKDLQVPVTYFASAVNNKEGRAIGVVVARVLISHLFERVKISAGIQGEEEIDIVNRDSLLIYSNYNREGILKDNLSNRESLERTRQGKIFGTAIHRHPGKEKETLFAFCREQGYLDFKGNDWIIIFHVPTQVIFGPVNKLLKILIIMFLAMLPGLALVIYLFSKTVTRPLNRLSFAVAEIGKSKLDTVIEVKSKDEFSSLANTFNQMVADLKKTTTSIDSLNKEITERKQAEEVLKDSEERYRTAIEYSNDGVAIDKDGLHLFVNQKFLELFGYNYPEEVIGKHLILTVHPDDKDRVEEINLKRQRGEDVPSRYEFKGIRKDGEIIYIEVSATKTTYRGKTASLAYLRDITERKQAEQTLLRSEEEAKRLAKENAIVAEIGRIISSTLNIEEVYERFAEEVHKLIPFDRIVVTLNNFEVNTITIAYVSGKAVPGSQVGSIIPLNGSINEEIVRTRSSILIQTEDIAKLADRFPALRPNLQAGIRSTMAIPLISKDQVIGALHFRSFKSNAYTEMDFRIAERVSDQIAGAIASAQLFTERKRAEEALRESEKRYRTAIEHSNDGVVIDQGGQHLFVNQKYVEIFGYDKPEEIVGKPLSVIVHPDDLKLVEETLRRRQAGEVAPSRYEFRGIRKNGEPIDIEVSAARIMYRGEAASLVYLRDITERKRTEEALRESEELYRTLIETSPDAILLADTNTNFIMVNQVAVRLYGYQNMEEMIGKTFLDLIAPEERPRLFEHFKATLQTGSSRAMECTSLKKDGSLFPIEVNASLFVDAQGRPKGTIAIVRDNTERKHTTAELFNLNKQLETAKEAAEAGSRAKSEFLASMSHEIRTPLNAVIGMLGLLSTSELSGPHREYVEIAHKSADGLLVIINDILDFSKIEAGKLLFEPVPFDLLSVVEETIDMMVMKTREKGLDLTVQYGPDVPRHFIGDSGRIRQVLINLVNNAIKFTQKGHIVIDVRAEEQVNEELLLRIIVEDTGIGIPSDTLDSLFKPFVQADASTTRRYGGTGLGLAISKRLVEMMRGTIGASSRMGEGSAFWFTLCLPLDKQFTGVAVPMAEKVALHLPAESGATQTALPKTARWGRPLRVLVVEDNIMNQRVTLLMLTELGCHVDLAANGRESIEIIELLPFDMVFMDCEMPEMDGFEATREIRRLQGDKHLPIIAMTAYALQGDREQCLAAGMDDYLSKPVKLEDFQAALERWGPKEGRFLEGRLKPPASLEKAPLTVENKTSGVIDPHVIARLRGLADATDPSLLMRIFHLFLSDTPERITTLREAAATGDTAGLSKAAHSLRGACASIGVMGMAEICKILESLGHGKYVDGAMALVEKLETEFNQVKVEIKTLQAEGRK